MPTKPGRRALPCRLSTLAAAAAIGFLACAPAMTAAQETYRRAPDNIARILEAPRTPAVSLDPHRKTMLLVAREDLPPVADLAQPMLRLAGQRINPKTNGPHGPRRYVGLTLKRVADGRETPVKAPAGADIGFPSWSPDGSRFAFTVTRENGIELWVGDAATGSARPLTGPTLNTAAGGFSWMPDGRRVLALFVPESRGEAPERGSAPTGPIVQESSGSTAPVRTYQDLLSDPHDEALFDYYMTAQLAYIDTETGKRTDIGAPAMYADYDPSPSGEYLLVSRVQRPYSYLVPRRQFPELVEVWDAAGNVVREIARVPLREEIPIQGVQKGPRGFQWRDTAAHTLLWVEALDEGDPKNTVPHRDRLMVLEGPFEGEARERLKTEHRFSGVTWLDPMAVGGRGRAMVSEYDRDRRWSRTWLHDFDNPVVEPKIVWDRSVQDRYNNPGSPLRTRLPSGRSVVRVVDGSIYLSGQGATPEGDRPFLDRMELASGEAERLWRCEGACIESVVDVLSDDGMRFMTSYQSPTEMPNYFIRDLASVGGARKQVTHFEDPAPELRDVKKELVTYTRADGVKLSATMYTPPGYDPARDGRLPLLVWAYPQEYNDPATAGQVSGSPHRFTQIGGTSHLFMVLQGYAVMDGATMPVVGDPETVNDTFVEQVVASAQAAVDKAVEMGIADRDRVAVGGHSYGAFMTANLLAHCDLFRAGIARSGAYNRSLTPFGFQGERRTYWEAVDVYTRLSPFTYANKITEPLLLIHGELDPNPGTFPIQSERLYHAVKGHGGTARLVQLPYEGHGYQAKESVMHTLAEMTDWLDRFVKSPSEAGAEPTAAQ
jgi:dipeptidyl aminopeptidase/acylaminoacyl peptidase